MRVNITGRLFRFMENLFSRRSDLCSFENILLLFIFLIEINTFKCQFKKSIMTLCPEFKLTLAYILQKYVRYKIIIVCTYALET